MLLMAKVFMGSVIMASVIIANVFMANITEPHRILILPLNFCMR